MCEIGDVLCSLEISAAVQSNEILSYLAGVVQPFPYYQVGADPGHHQVTQQLPPDVPHSVDPVADAQHMVAAWRSRVIMATFTLQNIQHLTLTMVYMDFLV